MYPRICILNEFPNCFFPEQIYSCGKKFNKIFFFSPPRAVFGFVEKGRKEMRQMYGTAMEQKKADCQLENKNFKRVCVCGNGNCRESSAFTTHLAVSFTYNFMDHNKNTVEHIPYILNEYTKATCQKAQRCILKHHFNCFPVCSVRFNSSRRKRN